MTRYLLDRDVMSQLDQPDGARHENVRAWLETIPDDRLYVSAITVMEAWKGLAAVRRRAGERADRLRACLRYEAAFGRLVDALADRIVPIDEPVAKQWGMMLGARDAHRFDACVAATATVHGMVVASRNVADFRARGARVVDPFARHPTIEPPGI